MHIIRESIETHDGVCRVTLVKTDDASVLPAVILYMDALGMRPGLIELAGRIAGSGYAVLVPDLFYRFGGYGPLDPAAVFAGDFRAAVGPMMATTSNEKAADDTGALLAWLGTRDDVAAPRIGVVGFCMGGGMALTAAGRFPDRITAAASFHGGNLATDRSESPHRQVTSIDAEVYIATAENDPSYPPEMAEELQRSLAQAGVEYVTETYAGARHGWMVPDLPVYDEKSADRGHAALRALLGRNLL